MCKWHLHADYETMRDVTTYKRVFYVRIKKA